jgi:hypothetical protein
MGNTKAAEGLLLNSRNLLFQKEGIISVADTKCKTP